MDRLQDLNPSQADAVRTISRPLLVLAGAGTGKTRVITHRIAELIRNGVSPERILSVTFTNKAAREMQQRTLALFRKRPKEKPWISTFHSLCVRILRREITALSYPLNFSIYDRGDQESAARTALRDVRVSEKTLRPGDLLNIISRWKMAGVTPAVATNFVENDQEFLATVAYRKYQRNLRASASVDFDDLLLLTKQLFEDFPKILNRHQQRFDHVQIDEYQDTNGVQFAIIEALVREHQNLCVVGDDDQSIYGWRGADVQHILDFQSHFPTAKVVRLEDNYRCTDRILDLANRLVRHNRGRHEKKLIAHKHSKSDVRFLDFPDETIEAEKIVAEIQALVEQGRTSAGDFAILFRTNEQPRVFESELRRVRLRYILVGGQSFFDRREIRDLLAYLKAIVHPADEASLLRIINTPTRGIGASTIDKLLTLAVRQKCSIWDAIPQAVASAVIPLRSVSALKQFQDLLEKYRRRFEEQASRMVDVFSELVEEIGYQSEIEKQYKLPEQQLARAGMVEQLFDSMKEYADRTASPSLSGYLEEAALLGRDEESDSDEQSDEKSLKLMTLHSAKGLEFPCVYIVGLEEGILPHKRSIEGADGAIDEERRLAYVGITRAMDQLTLSRAEKRRKWGKIRDSLPSRFLFEMRED